jgi:WXXGXW repeat (2 copies)
MLSKSWRLSMIPALLLMLAPALSNAQVNISVNIAPPELPVYDQPPIPGDGYLWTPGYWAWGDDIQDYYWVPGTWVEAPQPDYLWTPGYWAADGGAFLWHAGYWGPQVGFYGGVNYGYGYGGNGYEGGYWRDGHIFYNRAVVNVGGAHVTNVYNKTVVNNINVTRVSFNGGNGGVRAQASSAQLAAARERHIDATPMQREHAQTARNNPELRAASNHGHPPIAATPRAGNFANPVPARNAGAVAPRNEGGNAAAAHNEAPRNEAPRQSPRPAVATPRPTQQVERDAAAHDAAARDAATLNRNREGAAPNRTVSPTPGREVRPAAPNPQNAPEQHAVQPRLPQPAPQHVVQPPPPQHAAEPPRQPVPPARVEPRREPEHTEVAKPAPKPQARPAEHPAEHPEEHEHH